MKWFEETAGRLEHGRIYSRQQLIVMLQEDYNPFTLAGLMFEVNWGLMEK